MLIAFKHHFGKTNKEINDLAVSPAAVLLNQVQRHFKVRKGNDRFDIVLEQFIKHVVVEFQPFFIWLCFVTLWEDSGPGDGRAEAFKAHFGKQLDVFFIVTIKIDRFVVRVIFTRHHLLSDFTGYAMRAAGQNVTNARSFTAFAPAAFNLMCSNRAAPEKIFW